MWRLPRGRGAAVGGEEAEAAHVRTRAGGVNSQLPTADSQGIPNYQLPISLRTRSALWPLGVESALGVGSSLGIGSWKLGVYGGSCGRDNYASIARVTRPLETPCRMMYGCMSGLRKR